jgi:PhnB protein
MADNRPAEVLLDDAVSALLAGRPAVLALSAEEGRGAAALDVAALVEVARDLRELPAPAFRRRLGEELSRIARSKEKEDAMVDTLEQPEAVAEAAAAGGVRPYLVVRDARAALDFYRDAFGATETYRLTEPGGGRVGHAEMRLGEASWMLADEHPEYGTQAPASPGAAGVSLHFYVPDVDAFVARAEAAGATVTKRPTDEFYGDRSSRLVDPFGHVWGVATHKENVAPTEVQRRFEKLVGEPGAAPAPSSRPAARPGFHAVTPYLQVRRPAELLDFVKTVFGAVETMRATGSAGGMHAEVRIGDSMVMIGGMESLATETPAALYLYIPDVDAAFERALAAGATSLLPPTNQDYGDRNAWVKDRFGNTWYLAQNIG